MLLALCARIARRRPWCSLVLPVVTWCYLDFRSRLSSKMKYFRDPKTSFENELQTHVLDVILAQIELYFEAFWGIKINVLARDDRQK